MSPDDALQLQIERYRRMTPEERLRLGLELHEMVCQMSRAGIRSQHPHATPAEVEQELVRRLQMSRS
jgi:hypothetical protein